VGISAAAAMIIEEDLDKEVAFISKMHDENNTQQVVDTDEIELQFEDPLVSREEKERKIAFEEM